MPAANPEPIIQQCKGCGANIDVSGEEPLALMHCTTCGHAMRVRTEFDHFKLLEILGAGGMGAVYRATDTRLNRTVALKLLRREHVANQNIIEQFAREAAVTASISHQNVVKVYSAGTDHGVFYIAMEIVDKGSLDDLMALQGRVAEAQVLDVGIQIAHGLNAAYKCGLIHRDVKPANILFSDPRTAKIVDFGLAILAEHAESANQLASEIWGTPYYVAPEKLESPPEEDFRSDIYSLGSTLFHAIAGRPPYEAEDASIVVLKHLKSQPVSVQSFAPDVSSATAYVINRMIAKDPKERYQSYEELIEHLQYAKNELLKAHLNPGKKAGRVVTGDEGSEGALSWVTFVVVAAIVVGIVLFLYTQNHVPTTETPKPPGPTPEPVVSVEPRYQAARQTLLADDPAVSRRAAASFRELDGDGVPQPLRNWITLHAGLANLLAGQREDASADFGIIVERGLISEDPTEQKLAGFFIECAQLAAGEKVVKPAEIARFDDATHEAIGVLACAVKDWSLGEFDAAGALFRRFADVQPEGRDRWIADYKPLAAKFLADYTEFRAAVDATQAAGESAQKRKDALAAVQHARLKVKRLRDLRPLLDGMESKLNAQIASDDAMTAKAAQAIEAKDVAALASVRSKVDALCQQLRFAEAHALAAAAPPATAKLKPDYELLVRKLEWLAKFKATLVADIARGTYPGELQKRTGARVQGGATSANEVQLDVKTPYGPLPVKWIELTPECISTMAQSFIRPTLTPEQIADRQWLLGLYAMMSGREQEGRALLTGASAAREEYRAVVDRLIGSAESPPPTPP